MTQVAEKHQPWTSVLEERPTTGPRWLQEIRDRGAAFRAAWIPDRPQRGVAVYERVADCRGGPGPGARLDDSRSQPARHVPVCRCAAQARLRERPLRRS